MTQYRLKKDTFGIPAGTIAERRGAEDYIFRYDCHDYWVSVPRFMVEQISDFEKVEEPKKEGSMYSTAADCSRVTVSCEGRAKHEVYAEAWGDFIEEHALVDDEPEWEKRFDAAYNYPPSEQVRRLKDFMLDEYLIMGEEIMELSNNQTNRAFCDDVMQVMRERGAIK